MDGDGDSGRRHIPRWDGHPATWKQYEQEVRIWRMGENLDVKYCIAARLIQNLSGAARRAALQLKDEQLQGTQEDRAAGIKAVLAHLNRVFSPDPLIRKAQSLSEFFSSRKYYRRQGQRMTDFVTTFDEGVTQMAADGINVEALKDVLGWFFLQYSGLTSERRERVLGALGDAGFEVEAVRRKCVALFPELHVSESMGARGGNRPPYQSRFGGGQGQQAPPRRDVNETAATNDDEAATNDEDPHDYELPDALDPEQFDLSGALRGELEALAADIEQYGADADSIGAEQINALEDATARLADAAEALETVRDARQRLRPGDQPAVSTKAKGKGKGKGKAPAKSIAERKANSTCKACGGRGHWSGDRECPRTAGGAGAQSVHVTDSGGHDAQALICEPCEALLPETSTNVQELKAAFENEFPETITNVQELNETYVLSANALNETDPDAGRGIFDTACALSVAGCAWTRQYLRTLECLGLSHLVQEDVATETFRFGDGHGVQCNRRVTAPVVIANQPLMLRWHVLDGYKLSLLLGQDFIAQTGAIFDGKKHKLSIDGRSCSLGRSKRGHFSVNLNPEHCTPRCELRASKARVSRRCPAGWLTLAVWAT